MRFRGTEHDAGRSYPRDTDRRWPGWRRLTLRTPTGKTFLERRGLDLGLFGIYLHRIDLPDPGLDLHDHPWPFVSLVLRGGYIEEHAPARRASEWAKGAEMHPGQPSCLLRGVARSWRAGTVHRIALTDAHRIVHVTPGTVTLILRGRKVRPWGFYLPTGWVDQRDYDYVARRPLVADRGGRN